MPSDYERILEQNLHEYGHGDRHLKLLGELYPQRTHFILELIQNAEDAKAKRLEFRVFDDRLEVVHDGRLFDERDVRGVCGVGDGTKAEDLTSVGRFGVGFKSVFAYTKSPVIHSGDEHFRIEQFIRPHAEPPPSTALDSFTSITLPFNAKIKKATARSEIVDALDELEPTTLLFLRHIGSLAVHVDGVRVREITRKVNRSKVGAARVVRVANSRTAHPGWDDQEPDRYLMWSRPVPGHTPLRVELAAQFDGESVEPLDRSPLVVYFPTEKETNLPFLAQGPYRTTPARDNIPSEDDFNQLLVAETAKLLADVVWDLRDQKLLTADLLDRCALSPTEFADDSMFAPLRASMLRLLGRRSIVPVGASTFRTASTVALTTDRGLRSLLSPQQVGALLEGSPRHWVDRSVNQVATRELWDALVESLNAPWIDAGDLLQWLDEDFLEAQPDEWVVQLYEYLATRPPATRDFPIRSCPILRLTNGSHVVPVENGQSKAYLPGSRASRYSTVRPAVVTPTTRPLLESLGIREPDAVAEVVEDILPRYESGDMSSVDNAIHVQDLRLISQALRASAGTAREHLMVRIRQTDFLWARNAATHERTLSRPQRLWKRGPKTEVFFEGNGDVWWLDDPSLDDSEAGELGVRLGLQLACRPADYSRHVTIASFHGRHQRGLNRFDPEASVFGLEFALRSPSREKAELIWNALLVQHCHLIRGIVESSSRQTYERSGREEQLSQMGRLLVSAAWLPAGDGVFCPPAELGLHDLPDGFEPSDAVAAALGMRTSVVRALSEELGVDAGLLQGLKDNPEAQNYLRNLLSRQQPAEPPGPAPPFADLLAEKTGAEPVSRPSLPDLPSPRPVKQGRAEREAHQLEEAQAVEELAPPRFKTIPKKVWEQRNHEVRDFLRIEYGGRCQICDGGFTRRDGQPYFVGNYWVSVTNARWMDQPGNALSLCPTCSAKLEFADYHCPDLLDQIREPREQDADGRPQLEIQLCGEAEHITFTPQHLLKVQTLVEGGG